jgi:hypothetical protein
MCCSKPLRVSVQNNLASPPDLCETSKMSNLLSYKGFQGRVEFDERIFFGRVAGIEDVGFHTDAVDGLITAFHEAVDDYLETAQRLASSRINAIRAN